MALIYPCFFTPKEYEVTQNLMTSIFGGKDIIMTHRVTALTTVFCLFLALTITGCAKKPAEQTQEVAPAQAQQGTQTPSVEQNKGEAAPTAQAAKSTGFDKKIYFDFDMYTLTPESTATLNELIAFMKSNVNLKVKIEGNCDERGTTEYNLRSEERRVGKEC